MNCHPLHTKGESAGKLLTKSEDRKSNGEGATSTFGTTIHELLLKINNIETNYTKNHKKKSFECGNEVARRNQGQE